MEVWWDCGHGDAPSPWEASMHLRMIEPPCLFYIRMRSLLAQALNRILGSYKTPAYTTGAQATNSERDVAIILCAPAGLAYSGGYLRLHLVNDIAARIGSRGREKPFKLVILLRYLGSEAAECAV
jgi:hypothetical protein